MRGKAHRAKRLGQSGVCAWPTGEIADLSTPLRSVEKHFQERSAELQIPRLRGMTKERATLLWKVVSGPKAFFIALRGPQDHDSSDRSVAEWRDLRFLL
jgi:hypothetical protein